MKLLKNFLLLIFCLFLSFNEMVAKEVSQLYCVENITKSNLNKIITDYLKDNKYTVIKSVDGDYIFNKNFEKKQDFIIILKQNNQNYYFYYNSSDSEVDLNKLLINKIKKGFKTNKINQKNIKNALKLQAETIRKRNANKLNQLKNSINYDFGENEKQKINVAKKVPIATEPEITKTKIKKVSHCTLSNYVKNGEYEKVEQAILSGTSVDSACYAETVLASAIRLKQNDIVELLLRNKANPDKTSSGITNFEIASQKNNFEATKLLIKYKADVNKKSIGLTPLDASIQRNQAKIARELYLAGAICRDTMKMKALNSNDLEMRNIFAIQKVNTVAKKYDFSEKAQSQFNSGHKDIKQVSVNLFQNQNESQSSKVLRGSIIRVSAGTDFNAVLQSSINTASMAKNDTITAILNENWVYKNVIVAPKGSILYGSASDANAAKVAYGNGRAELVFNEIMFPDGKKLEIYTKKIVYEMKNSRAVNISKDLAIGTIIGALGGLAVGGLTGDYASAIALGAGVGLASGGITAVCSKGENIDIPEGTVLNIKLAQPINISP